jgi:hypothetical protein
MAHSDDDTLATASSSLHLSHTPLALTHLMVFLLRAGP